MNRSTEKEGGKRLLAFILRGNYWIKKQVLLPYVELDIIKPFGLV
jgi:hypothetical protein